MTMGLPVKPVWHPAGFYTLHGEQLHCTLCPHNCRLAEGETGLCHVRRRRGTRMETATFASSVQHITPIERKPFYHYRPASQVLTLAAPGCSFRCHYCLNDRLSQYGRDDSAVWQAVSVDIASIVERAHQAGAAIGLSYSEPSLAAELTQALAEAARPFNIPLVWKSNGFLTETALHTLLPSLAAVNIDLKTSDDRSHRRLTGASLQPVLDTLHTLRESGTWLEVSTPLIPDFNTDDATLHSMAALLHELGDTVPWHLLRFTPAFRFRQHNPTPPSVLEKAVSIARQHGLQYVYVERALGDSGSSTSCPQCDYRVIERSAGVCQHNYLQQNHCPACGHVLPGIWTTEQEQVHDRLSVH